LLIKGFERVRPSQDDLWVGGDAITEPGDVHRSMIGAAGRGNFGHSGHAPVAPSLAWDRVNHGCVPMATPRVFDSEASMAQLIVGLTPALARALARGEQTRDTTRLRDITAQAQVELRPQTARSLDALDTEPDGDGTGDADPEPTVWFFIETDDGDQPDDLDAQLLRIPGVTAAYVTPDQGPP